MLDLEKKFEHKTDEMHQDFRRDMAKVLDDRDIKHDVSNLLEEKIDHMEFNFNSKVLSRLELLEKAYDQQLKNYSIFESKIDIEG